MLDSGESMSADRRGRGPARWAGAVLAAMAVMGTLTGCGGHDTADARTGAATGATAATGPTRATDPAAASSLAPSPAKNPTDQPSRPTLPPVRKPVLHVHRRYTYTVQILDARTMVDVPDDPPPAGTKAVGLLLRVEAEPRNRSVHAPYADLAVDYPSLEAEKNQYIGGVMDGATPYMTEDQLLFGDDGVAGVDPVFGTLEANTVYYHWAWQLVSEKADLTGASLCEVRLSGRNCIPIGAITADS